ncbi:hypothetical protein KUCAC02_026447, partial [Chaenocephalus aceratus]
MEHLAARCHTCQTVQSMLCFGPPLSWGSDAQSAWSPFHIRRWAITTNQSLLLEAQAH